MKSFLADRSVKPQRNLAQVLGADISALARVAHDGGMGGAGDHGKTNRHSASGEHGGSPQIECVRQGEKITRLIVTCECGQRIEIECLYPAGG